MSSTILRRARGVAVTACTWALTWAPVGAVCGAVLALVNPWPDRLGPSVPDLAQAMGLAGMIAGGVCGVAYAGMLIWAGRRRRFDQLRVRQVAGLGALAGASAAFLISRDVAFASICAGFGLAASSGSLVVARKAVSSGERRLELEAALD